MKNITPTPIPDPGKDPNPLTTPVMDKKVIADIHKNAAGHFDTAAKHHLDAAKHYEDGNTEEAFKSTVLASASQRQGTQYQQEDIAFHATNMEPGTPDYKGGEARPLNI